MTGNDMECKYLAPITKKRVKANPELNNKYFCLYEISDINMPYMNGIELLKIIRSKYPEIKVILLTGYANEENAMNAENLGVYAFLSKSLDMFKLVKIINRLEQEQEGLKNFRLNPVRTGASRLPIGVGGFIKG